MVGLNRKSLACWTMALIAGASGVTGIASAGEGDDARYAVTPLVSDTGQGSTTLDPNLINPWGIAFNPTGPVWLSDNGSGKSTLYDGTGKTIPLVVDIPAAGWTGSAWGSPTGIVYNGSSSAFVVNKTVPGSGQATQQTQSAPAKFLFASEDGLITGWSPTVDLTHALVAVDQSAQGAVFKGLAIGANGAGPLLYAADFHNRRVDVFDATFKPVNLPGAFVDRRIPAGFAPFGIQNVNGDIVVTYAKQDAAGHDNLSGRGLGYVDVFDPNGRLVVRLHGDDAFNAPWGVALAPTSFGGLGGTLLVGNFGNGRINAFDTRDGRFLGSLHGADGNPIWIEGLWGLSFGNGFLSQGTNALYYSAGPGHELHGVYGVIRPTGDSSTQ